MAFLISQMMGGMWTAMAVKVIAVMPGGLAEPAKVDMQPCVHQTDGLGVATPHGTIYGVNVMRLQGGPNALIIDPVAGDTGLAVFCHSDISSVAASKAPANPGSRRKFDPADAIYVGSLFGATPPTRYVWAREGGIDIVAPDVVTIKAPSIVLDGEVSGSGPATFAGDVVGDGVSLRDHLTTGVTAGGSLSGPPQP